MKETMLFLGINVGKSEILLTLINDREEDQVTPYVVTPNRVKKYME